jgi:metal-dependent amidase/aminoacylase/carboxypeptidase family protein
MAAAFRALGGTVQACPPVMYGEDFAYFLERIPGGFAFLGAGDGTAATGQGFHHPCFGIAEEALAWGAALHSRLVLDRAQALPGEEAGRG